ncbi:MAG: PEGA domain-containing protein [Woeseiaceae bacterium]|nr:PEGA domain-containing protein [Woeseiaceae bacterium]
MNFTSVVITDSQGERRFGIGDLPLRIGTGIDCEIRVPGPGSAAVALFDELDGEPFVQPVGRSASLSVNGDPLRTSRKLAGGDELQFFGTRIVVEFSGDALSLQIHLEDSAYITKPPELPDSDGQAASETIAATPFQRAQVASRVEQKESSDRWKVAVGVAILALLLVSSLLFTSKSIQFDVQPAGADSLSVDGGWFKLPMGDRILMRQGRYTVNVSKEGYYDVSQAFEVDDAPSRTIRIEMRRLPGQLTVTTDPPVEAVVTVDDDRVGRAPFGPLELEPGTHSVTVQAERFLPFAQRLEVPGLGKELQLDVQLVPRWANVEISSDPPGASILQGTTEIGTTPAVVELLEGSHSLIVMLDGYEAWDGTVEAVANETRVLPTVQLQPANAQLLVNSIPRGANITVNGRYRGQSPATISLSPDVDYVIRLSKAGYGTAERRIRLQAAASQEITVDMTARTGEVTVAALPGDATVFIDGRPRGTGTVTLNLTATPHKLEVKREGYQSFSRSITPRPGYPQRIPVRLLSEAQIRAQNTATTIENSQGQVLRRMEPGSFTMGTSRSEQGRRANEVIVPVQITRPYFIGIKEVTNREFRRFRQNHDSRGDIHVSLAGDLNPVVNVTWEDAVEYCNWLSTQEGLPLAYKKVFERWQPIEPTPDGYRLPTEAEWVWAIRYQGSANAQTFPWGRSMPPRRDSGNYADRSANALVPSVLPGYDDGYASTAPVGTFPPNALGIYDGGGNVAEWVQDYYHVPTPGQTEPVKDPRGPARGGNRVIRGSSWMHAGIMQLRMGYRDFGNRGRPDVGFRIARNVP